MSALETLFPGGSFTKAEDLYERAPLSAYFRAVGRAALEAFVRCQRNSSLRVLEIGAGTGATASALLPVLPSDLSIYYFTDVSEIFLHHGEQKFAAYPSVQYGQLDIETDTTQQGYPSASFDVVVATNVLRARRGTSGPRWAA